MIYKVTPAASCKFCHGFGLVYESHPYGSTTASEELYCGCVEEQLPEGYDCFKDEIELVESQGDDTPKETGEIKTSTGQIISCPFCGGEDYRLNAYFGQPFEEFRLYTCDRCNGQFN